MHGTQNKTKQTAIKILQTFSVLISDGLTVPRALEKKDMCGLKIRNIDGRVLLLSLKRVRYDTFVP